MTVLRSRRRGPAARWRHALAQWAIPAEILDAAPESPWGFDVGRFQDRAREAVSEPGPAVAVARAALLDGGSVLDVGCGGGAASLPLVPPAGEVVGVDESAGMLEVFATAVRARGATPVTVEGSWPDIASEVPAADVAVAQDVAYNVADLAGFVERLTDHARQLAVMLLPERHPLSWLTPYWRALHGLDRPASPTADDALAVIAAAGLVPAVDRVVEPTSWAGSDPQDALPFLRRRLCLTADRDDALAELLARIPPPRHRLVWVISWAGAG